MRWKSRRTSFIKSWAVSAISVIFSVTSPIVAVSADGIVPSGSIRGASISPGVISR